MKKTFLFSLHLILLSTMQPAEVRSQFIEDAFSEPRESEASDFQNWFYSSRTFGLGYIPQNAWTKAVGQRELLRSKYFPSAKSPEIQSAFGLQSLVNWTLVGPLNIEQGSGAHAGRVNTIVTHPTDPNIAYLGAANGGIWKTLNGARSWKPLTDNAISLAMGALAIDPSDPNILYAGTGEFAGGVSGYFGAGMLKTTDAGATWISTGLPNVGGFSKIIINPNHTSIIYAAGAGSGGGLYISKDAGKTWNNVAIGLPQGDVTDIAYGQNNSNDMIWAALPSHGIYLSQDGGVTWDNVKSFSEMRRIHVDVDPNNWRDAVALSVNFQGAFEGLERTTDGGVSWHDISSNINVGAGLFGSNAQGWYDVYVRRDPLDPLKILVGGISIWKSVDGGSNWTDVGRASSGSIHHTDQHVATFASKGSNILYAGSDGGVAVSVDRGSNYNVYQDSLSITESYGIAIDQTVNDISYTGNQDNGTLSGGRTGDWTLDAQGDGGTVVVDASDHNIVYFIRPTAWEVRRYSVLSGSESDFSSGINLNDSVFWNKPIEQDETNHILYTGSQFLYVLPKGQTTWVLQPTQLATRSFISAIAPAGDGKTLLVGTTGGKVWSTVNNGSSFVDRSAGLPGRFITSIKVSPSNQKTFYVALSGFGSSHLYMTSDLGATWKDISSTLPDISCNAIVIDPQHPTNLYVGTDVGVFFSPNDGTDWMPFGSGLPNVAVTDLAFHKTNRVLRAGTHGRSLWEVPFAVVQSSITTPTLANVWYVGEPSTIAWYGIVGPVKIEISLDNAASWQLVADAATGTSFPIGAVRFFPSEHAFVRVSSGTDILISQDFRVRTRSAGSSLKTFSEQPLYMYDLAYDKDLKVLWVTNFNSSDNHIYKMDPDNGKILGSISVSGGRDFTGIKYDQSTKHLFVHQAVQGTNVKTNVVEVTTTGAVINKFSFPNTAYGTGINVSGDSLFLADRNNNIIHVVSKVDPNTSYYDLDLSSSAGRAARFGPRCIAIDQKTGNLLHTWTDFQGSTDANATLYDSYLLRLDRYQGTEFASWFVQDGTNTGTNARGVEYDPRGSGTTVWVTVLNSSGTSSKILKLTLVDGEKNSVSIVRQSFNLLASNYPNPASIHTTLPYSIDHDCSVRIILRDLLGREVYRVSEGHQFAGDHSLVLPVQSLASGKYFCELLLDDIRVDGRVIIKE